MSDPYLKLFYQDPNFEVKHLFKNGNYNEVIKKITPNNADIILTSRKNTILHKACQFNLIELVEKLLKNGVTVDAKNFSNWTPLLIALYHGNIEIAQKLIDFGADYKIEAKHKFKILDVSIKGIQLESIKFVIKFIKEKRLSLKNFFTQDDDRNILDHLVTELNSSNVRKMNKFDLRVLQLECLKLILNNHEEFCNIIDNDNNSALFICIRWIFIYKDNKKFDKSILPIIVCKLRRILEFYKKCGKEIPSPEDIASEILRPISDIETIIDMVNNMNEQRLFDSAQYQITMRNFLNQNLKIVPEDLIKNITEFTTENSFHIVSGGGMIRYFIQEQIKKGEKSMQTKKIKNKVKNKSMKKVNNKNKKTQKHM